MKNMRKLLALLLALTLCVSLALPAAATENAGYTITGIEATGVAGQNYQLQLNPAPAEDAVVTWSVNNEALAEINRNGNDKFIEQGTVTITASIAPVMLVQSLWL